MSDWWEKDITHKNDGKRVLITDKPACYKEYDLLGREGTVINWMSFNGKAAIQVDNWTNDASKQGYFYLKKTHIKLLEEENMNKIENYVNVAMIQFADERCDRRYQYANFDPSIRTGDLCVVMSANHGMGIAKVVEILPRNDLELEREIVAKVDTGAYDARVNQRKVAAELKTKMQERAKKLQDIALFQMLAKDDPEMAELLKLYQNVINN